MRYLVVVMLLTGCVTAPEVRKYSDERLCEVSDVLMESDARLVKREEMKKRGIYCLPAAGFAYPPPQQTIIVY